jgi:uncharacterized protein YbjT (DUF2867 family)
VSTDTLRKRIPAAIAIFGAAGRMGVEVAAYLDYARPDIRLRLLSSSEAGRDSLLARFPDREVLVADYLDRPSLDTALEGMQGVFVVTPSGIDEQEAMTNFIEAAQKADAAEHIVRILGYAPESSVDSIPPYLRDGDATQHYVAKQLLVESGLPVTYLNVGASLMDNLLFTAPGIRRADTFIWPQREVPLIDVRDLGEAAARLLLSDDRRHIGQFHTINNGQDYPTTSGIAEIMSEVFRRRIVHDGSWEAFDNEYGEMFAKRSGNAGESEYRYRYFDFEYTNWLWSLNDFAEKLLGREPNTFRSWLQEHRGFFEPDHWKAQ